MMMMMPPTTPDSTISSGTLSAGEQRHLHVNQMRDSGRSSASYYLYFETIVFISHSKEHVLLYFNTFCIASLNTLYILKINNIMHSDTSYNMYVCSKQLYFVGIYNHFLQYILKERVETELFKYSHNIYIKY